MWLVMKKKALARKRCGEDFREVLARLKINHDINLISKSNQIITFIQASTTNHVLQIRAIAAPDFDCLQTAHPTDHHRSPRAIPTSLALSPLHLQQCRGAEAEEAADAKSSSRPSTSSSSCYNNTRRYKSGSSSKWAYASRARSAVSTSS